jgi:hypothetical protein
MSARIYATSTNPHVYRVTYRPTGAAAPGNLEGAIVMVGDRDSAIPSYRANHGEAVDIYVWPVAAAGEVEVHSPMGGSLAVLLAQAAASLAVIDDWDEADRAKVNPIAGQAGVAAGAGNVSATTQRMLLATDEPHFGAVGAASDVDGVIHGQLRYAGEAIEAARALLATIDADTSALATTVAVATTSLRTGEIDPLSAQYDTVELVNNVAIIVDPGASYAPNAAGQSNDGYKGDSLQLYMIGGVGAAATNRTATVKIEVTDGLMVAAALRWKDITESVKDLTTGLDSYASFTATGATAVEFFLDLNNGNANWKAFRILYDWDADPSVTPGALVAVFRGRAL